ncbi:MAG: GTPase ObgE [Candidatus Nealsonbacteria bacterium]|nr:GTPase ObgE [Candidatus Nealsonbacteria bacterium]
MLIDDVTIKVKAGDGGKGAVAFNKNMMSLGPAGAKGGKGGDVCVKGVSDLSVLNRFRFKKEAVAQNGENGRSQFLDGKDAEDLILLVPTGTVVSNLKTKKTFEITKIGEVVTIAKGGKEGRGNFHFRSSTNTSPKEFEYGKLGQAFEIRLELKMIADVGFIGLPNVGKTSLLNELTNANSKVANYSFTTLEPNLGTYYELILADIPGLIEGASKGKGLGFKFLKHIERTNILFHFISAESADPVLDYKTVRKELEEYNKLLLDKKEYIFITKKDMVPTETITKIKNKLKKEATPISILDPNSIGVVKKILNGLILEKLPKN